MQPHSFADLGLSRTLQQAVSAQGYTQPTEIQNRAIPVLLSGANLLGTAQTGTGKTAAFTLPLLDNLLRAKSGKSSGTSSKSGAARPRALILAPTRELAIQIDESIGAYGAGSGVSHLAVFGGAPKGRQLQGLRRRPMVLAATPGRLLDFMGEGAIDLSGVEFFILDEADRMLDMGLMGSVGRDFGEQPSYLKQEARSACMYLCEHGNLRCDHGEESVRSPWPQRAPYHI